MTRDSRARAGLTVVEMIVVIMLLGVVGAVVTPAFRSTEGRRVGRAAGELRAAYAEARALAIRRGVPVGVHLDAATGEYVLVAAAAQGSRADTLRRGRLGPSDGLRIDGGRGRRVRATFHPLGYARADAVRLVSGAEARTVTVDPWTGTPRGDK